MSSMTAPHNGTPIRSSGSGVPMAEPSLQQIFRVASNVGVSMSSEGGSSCITNTAGGLGACAIGSGGILAGTKRPITSVDNLPPINREGRNLSEKKLKRLEKNRLSARECRRKKREAAQNVQREINVLEAENLRLRLQLQVCQL